MIWKMLKYVCFFAVLGTMTAHCPNGWTYFMGNCYHFAHEASTFTASENYCKQYGAHLAHVESAAETAFLQGFLKELSHTEHWIGLTDRIIEGVWMWSDDNSPVTYRGWLPGDPDGGAVENCVAIRARYSFMWTDDDCNAKFYPICKLRMESDAVVG